MKSQVKTILFTMQYLSPGYWLPVVDLILHTIRKLTKWRLNDELPTIIHENFHIESFQAWLVCCSDPTTTSWCKLHSKIPPTNLHYRWPWFENVFQVRVSAWRTIWVKDQICPQGKCLIKTNFIMAHYRSFEKFISYMQQN